MRHLREHPNPIAFPWPTPPLQIALVEPEIPPNTGNIARLCAATGTVLHLVGQLGFHVDDRAMRRAGLDYWDAVDMRRHRTYESFEADTAPARTFYFSTRGTRLYTTVRYQPGDILVFGSETRGLPTALLDTHPDDVLLLPVRTDCVRSLNLANAAAIALYEALRQLGA